MTAHVERKQGIIDGQMSLSGSNLKMRDLVVQRVSAQSSIANNVIHLNGCSATLNNTDFFNATGTFGLQPPHHYNGKISASVVNLAVVLYAVFPVWWIAALSFKDPSTLGDGNFIPAKWSLANYRGIFATSEFTHALINSIGRSPPRPRIVLARSRTGIWCSPHLNGIAQILNLLVHQ